MVPSSTASTSMVALSVSISAMMSPDLTLSPSFFSHLARLPFSIVGDSAGMRMLIGMASAFLPGDFFRGLLCRRLGGLRLGRFHRACAEIGNKRFGDGDSDISLVEAIVLCGINRAESARHLAQHFAPLARVLEGR